ncbi:MAG: bifunctional diguanylate cyclase/phosphodiesterase [Loktanella sp.]|jgi:diguanylate cyclase (GGDEF)-like protein|nr:bifunctional diguanylate cyclase/phosphodiesterase [Loktanella sp.]MDO7624197.1 bifunctional diguanylate cyclase/phosphodiesterase [Loktanella sp.]MDO7625839.1 bifunctional diguanylate cyclase/phosphodiesterase [Loktanella sp.]MDO7664887.1 bifunctional diguanylate cyclase/phosphodiesterase [Loktanella sp.]MDO7685754.1 bifunctional diguanylate cyclase/phosphodiesterase [Loktanella sp.]
MKHHLRSILMLILPAMVIFMTFAGFSIESKMQANQADLERHALAADRAANIIENSLLHIGHGLADVARVVEIAEQSNASQSNAFHKYLDQSHIFEEFPAIKGIGLVLTATAGTLIQTVQEVNGDPYRQGYGYLPFRPSSLADTNDHALLVMFEPMSKDAQTQIGSDIFSRRHKTVFQSTIDSREMHMSRFFEVHANMNAATLFVPLYDAKSDHQTPKGAIATVFRIDLFLEGLTQELAPLGVEVDIFDAGETRPELGFAPKETFLATTSYPSRDVRVQSDAQLARLVNVGGRQWRLQIRPQKQIASPWAIDAPLMMALIISILSGLLLYRMSRTADILSALVSRRTKSLKLAAAKLEREKLIAYDAATHDALTGHLNERGLGQAFETFFMAQDNAAPRSILSIDLDRFKEINDTTSYRTGNQLLVFVAEFLQCVVPEGTFLARFGGDEFLILTPLNEEGARQLAHDIVCWADQPQTVDGRVIRFGTSIGIASDETGESHIDGLLADANIALSEAKSTGRGRYCVYDDKIKRKTISTKLIADELRRALEEDEFEPYFQTQHDATDFTLSGVECLLRWNHPTRGILPPAAFLEVAETIGILGDLDAIALRKSCDAIAAMERNGFFVRKLSVNVSLARLRDPELLFALEALPDMQCELTFEILETVFIDELDVPLRKLLIELENRGISIEIDDFGSGRASILGLTQLDPARLKIDRALVMPLLDKPEQKELLKSIVAMGRALDIGVTAEGVETREHAIILREIGVDTLQGFYFSKPMPISELREICQLQAA